MTQPEQLAIYTLSFIPKFIPFVCQSSITHFACSSVLIIEARFSTGCSVPQAACAQQPVLHHQVNGTYVALAALLAELVDVFPDRYLHLGGDEVPFDCWRVCLCLIIP